MREISLSLVQLFLVTVSTLWFVGLGLSFLTQKQKEYARWSETTIKKILEHSWKYLLCFALGYWLANGPILTITP